MSIYEQTIKLDDLNELAGRLKKIVYYSQIYSELVQAPSPEFKKA